MTRWLARQIQQLASDPAQPVLEWLAPRVFAPWPVVDDRAQVSAPRACRARAGHDCKSGSGLKQLRRRGGKTFPPHERRRLLHRNVAENGTETHWQGSCSKKTRCLMETGTAPSMWGGRMWEGRMRSHCTTIPLSRPSTRCFSTSTRCGSLSSGTPTQDVANDWARAFGKGDHALKRMPKNGEHIAPKDARRRRLDRADDQIALDLLLDASAETPVDDKDCEKTSGLASSRKAARISPAKLSERTGGVTAADQVQGWQIMDRDDRRQEIHHDQSAHVQYVASWHPYINLLKARVSGYQDPGLDMDPLHPNAEAWARWCARKGDHSASWNDFCEHFGAQCGTPLFVWEQSVLWALTNQVELAYGLLLHLVADAAPPLQQWLSAVECLTLHVVRNQQPSAKDATQIAPTDSTSISPPSEETEQSLTDYRMYSVHITSEHIWNVLSRADDVKARALSTSFPLMSDGRHMDSYHSAILLRHTPNTSLKRHMESPSADLLFLSAKTRLQLTRRFAQMANRGSAVFHLKKAATLLNGRQKAFGIERHHLQWALNDTLAMPNLSIVEAQSLVDELIPLNVTLGVGGCNILMDKAMAKKDIGLVFKLFDVMLENGLQPDSETHRKLVRACKSLAIGAETLAPIVEQAVAAGSIRSSERLANEVLDALLKHHIRTHHRGIFDVILSAYQQLFDVQPLVLLGICDHIDTAQSGLSKMAPTGVTLDIMLRAITADPEVDEARPLTIFKKLCETNDPSMRSHVQDLNPKRMLTNLLVHFGRHRQQLGVAKQVLQEIRSLSSHNQGTKASTQATSRTATMTHGQARSEWFPNEQHDLSGLDLRTLSIVHAMLCTHATAADSLLSDALMVVDIMRSKKASLKPTTWLQMIKACERCRQYDIASWCLSEAAKQDGWDPSRVAGIRRRLATRKKQTVEVI